MARSVVNMVVFKDYLVCLCDDGTLWYQRDNAAMEWSCLPQVPQVGDEQLRDFRTAWGPPGSSAETIAERAVDQLVDDVLMDGESASNGERHKSVATVPAKASPSKAANARAAAAEKPAAPKTKAKPKSTDEDARPRVGRKQLVALGVLATMLAVYLVWPSGVLSPAQLARTAVSAGSAEDRKAAVAELNARRSREILPQIRLVLKESKDPEVIAVMVPTIFKFGEPPDIIEQFALLEHPDEKVRVAASYALAGFYGDPLPDGLVYDPKGPADERGRVRRTLQEKYEAMQKKALDDLNATKKQS